MKDLFLRLTLTYFRSFFCTAQMAAVKPSLLFVEVAPAEACRVTVNTKGELS